MSKEFENSQYANYFSEPPVAGDLPDTTRGQSVQSTLNDLQLSDVSQLVGKVGAVDGQKVTVASYHQGWAAVASNPVGGGDFVWQGVRAKSDHNGGTVISPTVPWDGNTGSSHTDFLNGVGETDGAGLGCWVRRYDDLYVEDFGAVTDGIVDCYQAIQNAADTLDDVNFGTGRFYSSQPIKTKHSGSYFREDTGQAFKGRGTKTVLTRNDTSGVGATNAAVQAQSFFSIHGSFNNIKKLSFFDCPVGIYFGQEVGTVEGSSLAWNKLKSLQFKNCGAGVCVNQSDGAKNHYFNSYEDLHIAQCQIGVYWMDGDASFINRNNIRNIRASRCWAGFYSHSNCETNTIECFHNERNQTPILNNNYSQPAVLSAIPELTGKGAAIVANGGNTTFISCFQEACDIYLYNAGTDNVFLGGLHRLGPSGDLNNSVFIEEPLLVIERDVFFSEQLGYSLPNVGGMWGLDRRSGVVGFDKELFNASGEETVSTGAPTTHYSKRQVYTLPSMAASTSQDIVIWPEIAGEAEVSFTGEIRVTADLDNGQSHYYKAEIIARRVGSRTITRYFLASEEGYQATAAGAGSNTTTFSGALSVTDKDLIFTLTKGIGSTADALNVEVTRRIAQA